jgi:hypothetical protein
VWDAARVPLFVLARIDFRWRAARARSLMAAPKRSVRRGPHSTEPNEDDVKIRYACLTACAAVLCLGAPPLRAADSDSHPQTQRDKFAACAHDSRGMKGEERREFMSECLRKHPADGAAKEAAVAGASGHGKLAPCNAEADRRKLHGDERSAFLGACLRG